VILNKDDSKYHHTFEAPSLENSLNMYLWNKERSEEKVFQEDKENKSKAMNENLPNNSLVAFSDIYLPKTNFGSTRLIRQNPKKPFTSIINERSSSIQRLNQLDYQIQEAQKHLFPGARNISRFRKKSRLLKTTRNNSLLK